MPTQLLRIRHRSGSDFRLPWEFVSTSATGAQDRPPTSTLFRETLEIQKRVLGLEHPETLRSVNNLAEAQSSQGRHEEAESLYRQALEIQRRVLGPEHPEALIVMHNLAVSLRTQGSFRDAEALHRQTLAIQKRVLGPGHPDTLKSLYGLACAEALQGARTEALQSLREAVVDGFSDAQALLEDVDLMSLRGDPEFVRIISTARVNKKRAAGLR